MLKERPQLGSIPHSDVKIRDSEDLSPTIKIYGIDVVRPQHRPDIAEEKLLRKDTDVKSQYEQALKEVMLEMEITAYYEPLTFKLKGNDIYPPDFITTLTVGGRQVVFETHNLHSDKEDNDRLKLRGDRYKLRMSNFRKNFGQFFYFVIIESNDGVTNFPSTELKPVSIVPFREPKGITAKYADEHWHMPRVKTEEGKVDREDYLEWKRDIKILLTKFIERRVDKTDGESAHQHEMELVQAAG